MIIASQNVYWFQGYPAENDQNDDINPYAFNGLLNIYKAINPDLLLLQEIQSIQVAKKIADILNMNFLYTPGDELKRYGGAFLYKSEITCNQIKFAPTAPFQRFCQHIKCQSIHFDFNIVNIHLPSERQLSASEAAIKRKNELSELWQHNQPPSFICGDFNEHPDGTLSAFLKDKKYIDAFDYNQGLCKQTKVKGNRGDFIYLEPGMAKQIASFEIVDLNALINPLRSNQCLSDHYPLILRLKNEI